MKATKRLLLKEKVYNYSAKLRKIINTLGPYYGVLYVVKAKLLKDSFAAIALWLALRGVKVIKKGENMFIWRDRVFYVPHEHVAEFFFILSELEFYKVYAFESRYDVVVDIGGFLGESAWWFLTEGYAKRVIVFEPVYYDLCRRNVGDVAQVYPYAVHWSKGKLKFKVSGGRSRADPSGEKVAETVTLAEILSSLTGSMAVKMDCEGCEEALLHTPCDVLRRAGEYVIEIHPWVGAERVVKYMENCGFRSSSRTPDLAYLDEFAIYYSLQTILNTFQ